MAEPHELYAGLRFTFLLADQYKFSGSWVYPESRVPYSLLRLITRGTADFQLDGETVAVGPGDVVLIPEGTRLSCQATGGEISFISIRFITSVKLGDSDFLSAYYGVPVVTHFGPEAPVRDRFEALHAAAVSTSSARVFRIRGLLELIIAELVERAAESSPPLGREQLLQVQSAVPAPGRGSAVKRDPRIEAVVDFLTHHPTVQADTDALCRLADLSPSALRRLFKAHTGKTIGEFVTELRMMTAARMLLITSERVGDIGRQVGYFDQNYFARAFKGVFGVSPQAYRAVSREQQ
ncbi:MAG: AraC family transcriptional regulator [Corynebacterium sp.]|uniref:helix-turn-helix transcriptional regulator n=1 Tax=Corynebacterium sp. TaxID=1720 RepID=UPI0026E01628|nr:AraC family transcriptional regulator [Corynebacterium sp.]MDO5670099.1 AraC family transcriptional regulator [Corynebacterium sp.]